jgi:hypothetical protein
LVSRLTRNARASRVAPIILDRIAQETLLEMFSSEEKRRICPSCAVVVRQSSRYCDHCGKILDSTHPPTQPHPIPDQQPRPVQPHQPRIDRQRVYEEERIRFKAQEELKKEQEKKKNNRRAFGCLLVMLIIGAINAIVYLNRTPAGTQKRLGCEGIVLTDRSYFDEYYKTIGAKDQGAEVRRARLILLDKAFDVVPGTLVQVLDWDHTHSGHISKIKILEGRDRGEVGWVPDSCLK